MITKLTVEGFKSLESVTVDLGQVNVFIGANGSGKSNLLEAVGVAGAAAFGRVDDESLLRRGVRPGVPKLYISAFPRGTGHRSSQIAFEVRSDNTFYQVTLGAPMRDGQQGWRFKKEILERSREDRIVDRTASHKRLNREQGLAALRAVELRNGDPALKLLDDLRGYCIYCANTPTLRGLTPDQQVREPVGLYGGRLPEAVAELFKAQRESYPDANKSPVRRVGDLIDWARSFSTAPASTAPVSPSGASSARIVRFTDRFMAEKRNVLTAYDASEGALYILFAAVLALHPRSPNCLAIDNLDQSLNPRLSMRLTGALCDWLLGSKEHRQVLVTIHNPSALDALPLNDERVRLFTVDRDNRGRTVVKRVELNDKLLSKASQGWTLSRLWANGLIGGVPNV
ncbi:MAG: AAA family ATPase [Blastocatellia bacterium]